MDRRGIVTARPARALAAALVGLAAACGGEHPSVVDAASEALEDGNGLALNGLAKNGLAVNGLALNGLALNGLALNGLGSTSFVSWFNQDLTASAAVMKYVYACAAPAGTTVTWRNPKTGVSYTWNGVLGLATAFARGSAPTLAEQRVVSACLAAHVNPYGLSVPISVLGRGAAGAEIPYTATEINTYDVPEACWFGNLFAGEGVGIAFDTGSQGPQQSATRACSFNGPSRQDCSPLVVTGKSCWDICSRGGESNFWVSCTWNGKVYPALTTRYRHQEVVTCGDGVCQVSEHCGTGTTANSCSSDCGVCR